MQKTLSLFIGAVLLISTIKASSHPGTTTELEQNATICDKAQGIIDKYTAFTEDYLNFAVSEIDRGIVDYIYNTQEISENIRELEDQRKFIERLDAASHSTLNKMLQTFLISRFKIMQHRYSKFMNKEFLDDGTERMQEKIACSTTMCQFYDELIAEVYSLTSASKLNDDTLRLISISPNLWPLLKGETEDLPNPDLAIYENGYRNNIKHNSDYYFYSIYVETKRRSVPIYGLGMPKDRQIDIDLSDFEFGLFKMNGTIEHPEIEIAEWLQRSTHRSIADEDYIKIEQKEVQSEETEASEESSNMPSAPSALFSPSDISAYSASPSDELAIVPAVIPIPIIIPQVPLLSVTNSSSAPAHTKTTFSAHGHSKNLKTTDEQPLPRGMRIFRSHQQGYRTNFERLGSVQLKTIEKLMDKHFSSISYQEFASLWRAINGEDSIDESKGSSHKTLLDADGKVVTGIFAHSKSMEYTKKTLPYLRAAIRLLGDERLTN